jgi:hypothetical protein
MQFAQMVDLCVDTLWFDSLVDVSCAAKNTRWGKAAKENALALVIPPTCTVLGVLPSWRRIRIYDTGLARSRTLVSAAANTCHTSSTWAVHAPLPLTRFGTHRHVAVACLALARKGKPRDPASAALGAPQRSDGRRKAPTATRPDARGDPDRRSLVGA